MKALKLILKIAVALILLIAVIIGGGYGYDYYETEQRKQAELEFGGAVSWEWYDEYKRIQITYYDYSKESALRKVNLRKNYAIYVTKNKDYELIATVMFKSKCEPYSKIVTSKTFSNGDPKTLTCGWKGNFLNHSVQWSGRNTDFTWTDDLDGFSFREDFSYWDFSVLDKEITLSKAKPTQEKVTESVIVEPDVKAIELEFDVDKKKLIDWDSLKPIESKDN